jgi:hypothetical protein
MDMSHHALSPSPQQRWSHTKTSTQRKHTHLDKEEKGNRNWWPVLAIYIYGQTQSKQHHPKSENVVPCHKSVL